MIKKTKELFFSLFIVVCLFTQPSPAHATAVTWDEVNAALSGAIAGLYQYVRDSATEIVTIKVDATDEYVAHQQIIAAEIEQQKKGQTAAVFGTLKQQGLTDAIMRNNLIYSPLSQSSFACCEEQRGVGIVNGSRSLPSVRRDIYTVMVNHNNLPLSPEETYRDQQFLAGYQGFQSGNTILTNDTTMNQNDVSLAAYTAALVTNPFVDYEPPAKYLAKPAGEKYQTVRRLKQGKIAISQMAIADIISQKTPVYPLQDWMEQMCRSIGISTNHPEIKNGMISSETLLDMEVASRYANPAYIIDLHRKTETGVLRELLAAEAVNMEFHRQELKSQQYMAALQASRSSTIAQKSLNSVLDLQFGESILQAR